MQRRHRNFLFVFALALFASHSAFADNNQTTRQPIGIYTYDDGSRIVVGIGTTEPLTTLDVSRGEVKVGSTGAPCTARIAGAIRYSDTHLQLCDGAAWRNVRLDKAE